MDKTTQKDRVLRYMRNHDGITSIQAFSDLGITRISARIADLRADGFIIASVRESGKNRYGEKTNYVRYILHEVTETKR